ncbi:MULTISPECIES: hypothetical protein [unclassified Bradyrhizobium]|uniref:hypothetical protein n=1 Tax=unclassified Bradyrhizobium TaxID=2631580 RepID=UPI002479FF8F|nr:MULTISPECIES: hypothetical protein [unclassified Bradyrhizobium]WGR72669.1 hypothetical protein MTX24_07005 [Bradyrhizobium sp. ISRA426]WGR77502.1 hypothetical protein MTX21_31955 [Bradyrhizobium sp. ISRA430]WGR87908.1 hypothetical protein MTX25_07005 [Bradyrhizobium sp. ISRA432]
MLVPGRRGDPDGKEVGSSPRCETGRRSQGKRRHAAQKAVVDARAELLRSASAETPRPTPPALELKVVDASPVPASGATALVPPAPDITKPATDQLTRDNPTPHQVDVETLLAAAPTASDAVAASVPPATAVAVPIAEAGDDGPGWTATWLGVLLLAPGVGCLLSSSRTLRGVLAG